MLLECDKSQLLMVGVQERLLPAMSDPALVLKNGGRLLEAARTLAVPVVVSEQYPTGLGRTVPELANLAPANAVHEKGGVLLFRRRGSALRIVRRRSAHGDLRHRGACLRASDSDRDGRRRHDARSSSTPSARALPIARKSQCAACRTPASGWRPRRWCCSIGYAVPERRNSRQSAG